jgi:hypothetical protein
MPTQSVLRWAAEQAARALADMWVTARHVIPILASPTDVATPIRNASRICEVYSRASVILDSIQRGPWLARGAIHALSTMGTVLRMRRARILLSECECARAMLAIQAWAPLARRSILVPRQTAAAHSMRHARAWLTIAFALANRLISAMGKRANVSIRARKTTAAATATLGARIHLPDGEHVPAKPRTPETASTVLSSRLHHHLHLHLPHHRWLPPHLEG